MLIDNLKSFLEGTVASDIAQATPNMGLQKRKRKGQGKDDCPCKNDPESEECIKFRQEKKKG